MLSDTIVLSPPNSGNGRPSMKFTYAPETKPLEGYTIKRAIQRGAFGEVYYALSDAGKEVALKLLRENLDIELRGVSQCLNLKHPNLVTIFDIKTDEDGDHWIVMEYVAGQAFDQILAEHPEGMPLEDVRHWMAGMTDGIEYLHSRGIVHRDLKPANIYVEHRSVKVGDVGLSKFISNSRRSAHTQSVGTVYYMAPEVAHGRYGREVDVYALAVMLYEMLTGRVPFDGETTAEILMKHLSEKPDLSGIPPRLRPVLARGLDKDPQRRTGSVRELATQFSRALAGEKIADEGPEEIPAAAFVDATPNNASSGNEPRAQQHAANGRSSRSQTRSAAPPRHGSWDWDVVWRIGLVVLIAMLVFSPGAVIATWGMAFLAGVLVLTGYGAYWVVREIVTPGRSRPRVARNRFDTDATAQAVRHKMQRVRQKVHAAAQRVSARAAAAADVAQAARAARATTPKPKPNPVVVKKVHRQKLECETPRRISLRRRSTDLSGAAAFSVLCTLLLTMGLVLVSSFPGSDHAIGLFAVTAVAGAWAVLGLSKLWEGTQVRPMTRRLILLCAGCGVGALAWFADSSLLVDISSRYMSGPNAMYSRVGTHWLHDASQQPTLAGYMVFFGALFGLRQWWQHVDSWRKKRFRVSSVLLTMLLAWVIGAIWSFPQDWGVLWAGVVSSVVQISAVWTPREERAPFVETQATAPSA